MTWKKKLFPENLWTREFIFWWIVSFASIFLFDLLWMAQTTFRALAYIPFWPILFLGATLLTFPSILSKNAIWNLLLLLAVDIVFIANLMYCRTYFNAIPFHSYMLAGNLADFSSSVTDSFKWYFLSLPLLAVGAYFCSLYLFHPRKTEGWKPYLYLVAGLAFLSWLSDCWRGGAFSRMDYMVSTAYEASSIPIVYSLPGFLVYDYLKSSETLSPENKKAVEEWLERHDNFATSMATDSLRQDIPARKNLILILCESLESWPIETSVGGKELTPFLNSLVKDSTTFYAPNVVTQVGHGRSIEAQLLMLAGLHPMLNDVYSYKAIENRFFTLPKAMKQQGARTYILSADKPYVWNQFRVAEAFGIDTLIHAADFVKDETIGGAKRLSDGSLMRQSVEKMKKGEVWPEGEQAFLMIVTFSGHYPFKLPEHLKQIRFKGHYPPVLENYMMTANYTDSSLATIINYLKSREDWEDTIVVITGDHEGLAADRKNIIENSESARFVDKSQHTPLIILNSPVTGKFDRPLGEVDIYSSLLELLNLNGYPWKGMGYSIFSPGYPGIAFGSECGLQGDSDKTDPALVEDIKNARKISDIILKFNLLNRLQK